MAVTSRVRIRYSPNNKSFGKMMMAKQTQDLADQAAEKGVLEAKALAASRGLPAEYIASIRKAPGPPVVMGGNPRRTARVHADYVYIEFGSGIKRPRPQGGRSPAYRILGTVGPMIGNPPDRR
jgi:hypothetical protein